MLRGSTSIRNATQCSHVLEQYASCHLSTQTDACSNQQYRFAVSQIQLSPTAEPNDRLKRREDRLAWTTPLANPPPPSRQHASLKTLPSRIMLSLMNSAPCRVLVRANWDVVADIQMPHTGKHCSSIIAQSMLSKAYFSNVKCRCQSPCVIPKSRVKRDE